MSQGPLCPNLSQTVQKEVSQMANHNSSPVILLGGLSVNLNHLKIGQFLAKNHLRRQDLSFHCISIASARAKGQGLLGHCPEAKTHFTVSNRDPNSAHHDTSV